MSPKKEEERSNIWIKSREPATCFQHHDSDKMVKGSHVIHVENPSLFY